MVSITNLLLLFCGLTSCGQPKQYDDYLVSFNDSLKDEYGYKNKNGEIVIPLGKYDFCFTDTFRTFAIVAKPEIGVVAIDRKENVLYKVFNYDNGPDYISDGVFRIIENNKIGYADSLTGKVIIIPQFACAFPFKNGVAKVTTDCKPQSDDEHSIWVSNNWYYIDKTGKKVDQPNTTIE
ncbi:WG repeat-containing protein [Daejeonella sp.]|uniref:WG repeat-containing protein n=1 Tax=Daejeonella sp. TaxID=2805397 RepID=UPI0030BE76D4